MRRSLEVVLAVTAVLAVSVAPGLARQKPAFAPTFAKTIMLPDYDGGEPSLAVDPTGNGGVYVTAPQSLGGTALGVGFWGSHDHGRTFPIKGEWGSQAGGGDSDVAVGLDHTVYIADLELAANAICRSADGGTSFVDPVSGQPCTGVVGAQDGFVSDREWLIPGPKGELYFAYHDGHVEFPYVFQSTDKARTFTPCGPYAFDTTGGEWQAFTPGPTSGTQVPRPVVAPDGSISLMYATATPPGTGGFDHLWLSSTPSCTPASLYTSHLIYQAAGASLSQPFDGLAADGGGTLYAIASGHLDSSQTTDNVWLFTSTDKGATWSAPIKVNAPGLTANMLPAVAGGARKGEVAVGWYGSSKSRARSDPANEWRYYIATSFDGGKHFAQSPASGIVHKGAQARALLDFTSLAVEPRTGAVMAAFAGDVTGHRHAYFARQTGGRFLR